jgi:hypothetical protein
MRVSLLDVGNSEAWGGGSLPWWWGRVAPEPSSLLFSPESALFAKQLPKQTARTETGVAKVFRLWSAGARSRSPRWSNEGTGRASRSEGHTKSPAPRASPTESNCRALARLGHTRASCSLGSAPSEMCGVALCSLVGHLVSLTRTFTLSCHLPPKAHPRVMHQRRGPTDKRVSGEMAYIGKRFWSSRLPKLGPSLR